ncbi:MAG: alanine racemase [Armatimonadetes bacterium]|nr:alanine racemase [Armatimonadota bacterium]
MHISELDTPAVLIDLDILERNIRRAQDYFTTHGIRFRPHMKTHKIPQIGRMQVDAGAVGLTCAKLGEVEVMAEAGIEDIFLAFPIWGAEKLARLTALAERCRLTVAFDSPEVADGIGAAAQAAGQEIAALVEIDTGTGRCGVAPGPDLVSLCQRVQDTPGLRFQGLMTYQGYVSGPTSQREALMKEENERIEEILAELGAAGLECEVVSGGSSPSLFLSHLVPTVTENRCGTYVFNDRNMVSSQAVTWSDCAMRIAVTVVSNAVSGQIIIDGGSKTFSSDKCGAWEGFGRVAEDTDLLFLKMNEEHGYVRRNGSNKPHPIGERLHVIPNHVCTAMNMHEAVWAHRDGEVVERWEVAARGKIR